MGDIDATFGNSFDDDDVETSYVRDMIRDYTRVHGLPKPRFTRPVFDAFTKEVDRENRFRSGSFETTTSYQNLVEIWSARALPFLIEDIRKEGTWWQFQMVGQLGVTALQQSILYPPEIQGYFGLVKARTLDWWDTVGQQSYQELSIPTLAENGIIS
jgi:hypothetical protein